MGSVGVSVVAAALAQDYLVQVEIIRWELVLRSCSSHRYHLLAALGARAAPLVQRILRMLRYSTVAIS